MKFIKIMLILFVAVSTNLFSQEENKMNQKDNLVLLKVKNDPTISFKIWFKVGAENDPKGKEGLAYITARMLSEGATKSNSYETILEKLYPLAASYWASASMEMSVFSGRVHKDNLNEYYKLFIDGLLNPAFKEDDFKRVKDETLNYLNTTLKYSSDEELGKAVLYNFIYDGTNYGHIVQGTITGVESITINDVKDFYNKYYSKNNYVLGIGGGFSDDLVKKIQNDLNKLPQSDVKELPVPDPKPINGINAKIIEKDANATAISMGFPIDVLRGQKDWYALAIANSWFGEHRNSSSHLYQVIREARGLNYGDYSYIENFPNGGMRQMPPTNVARSSQIFEIWIRPVPNETKHFSFRAAMRELQKMVDNGLTQEQFNLTKNFLNKYVLHYAPTTSERLGYALDDKFYGIDGSHLEIFRKMMSELTLEDVNKAIKKHLQYKNMKVVFITENGEKLKENLTTNAESPIQYATPKSEEVYQEDKEIIKYQINIPNENIKVVPVEELFK